MASTVRAPTEDDLLHMPRDGRKYELVDGEIRVSPAGSRHGAVSLQIAARLLAFVKEHGLGHVFDSSTGFRLAGRQRAKPGRRLRGPGPLRPR